MKAIENGPEDFWWPKIDGSVTMNELAHLVADKNPSIGMNRAKWVEEGLALIGIIMKKITELGFSAENAWNATFGDWRFFSATYEVNLEELSKLYLISEQLGYMVKDLHDEEETSGFCLAGGYCKYNSNYFSLADLGRCANRDCDFNISVDWLVLSK